MEDAFTGDLILSRPGELVAGAVLFGFVPETVFGSCGERSALGVLPGPWDLVLALKAGALARAHFRAILLEFLPVAVGPGAGFGVFDFGAVFCAHGEGCGVFIDSFGGDVVVSGAGLQGVAEGGGLSLCSDGDLGA